MPAVAEPVEPRDETRGLNVGYPNNGGLETSRICRSAVASVSGHAVEPSSGREVDPDAIQGELS